MKTRKKYDPKIPTKTPNTKPAKKRNNSNLRTSSATSSAELSYPDALSSSLLAFAGVGGGITRTGALQGCLWCTIHELWRRLQTLVGAARAVPSLYNLIRSIQLILRQRP